MNTCIYERSELKQHFKVGERAIVRDVCGMSYDDYVGQVGIIDKFDNDHDPWLTMGDGMIICAMQLEKVEKTLDNIKVGDLIKVKGGLPDKTVLGVCGQIVFLSVTGNPEQLDGGPWTIKMMKDLGFTVKGSSPEETIMTVKEVEEQLKITNLRIKKESK